MKSRNKKNGGENALVIIITLIVVASCSLSITYALQSASLGEQENTFTTAANITIVLTEEEWDGKDTKGTTKPGMTDAEKNALGENIAKKYLPGQEIPKNPHITNTSENDVCMAMTAEFTATFTADSGTETTYKFKSYNDFAAAIAKATSFDAGWTHRTGTLGNGLEVYYYNTKVAASAKTNNLFSSITLNSFSATSGNYTFTIPDGSWLVNGDTLTAIGATATTVTTKYLPKFEIKLKGYAVQAEGLSDNSGNIINDGKIALDNLIKSANGIS